MPKKWLTAVDANVDIISLMNDLFVKEKYNFKSILYYGKELCSNLIDAPDRRKKVGVNESTFRVLYAFYCWVIVEGI